MYHVPSDDVTQRMLVQGIDSIAVDGVSFGN